MDLKYDDIRTKISLIDRSTAAIESVILEGRPADAGEV
jgi:hypothetical protein